MMLSSLLSLFFMIAFAAYVTLIVKAFQKSVGWGFAALLIPFFGPLAFVCKSWEQGKIPFAVGFCACVAFLIVLINDPRITQAFWRGYAAGRERALAAQKAKAAGLPYNPRNPRAPHEVRDLAESETPGPSAPAATPLPPDPHAAQRAALVKHGADLQTEYQHLSAERTTLKPGNKAALAGFNVKAAHYQHDVQALQAEQAQLSALDHPGGVAAIPGR